MRNVAVIIPTLNEEHGIKTVIKGFQKEGYKNIFIIDGHSTDRTVQFAKAAGAKVLMQRGRGKGDAMRLALSEIDADCFVFIDGDGTYEPKEVGKLLKPVLNGEADMVVGRRARAAIPIVNRFGNWILNVLVRLFYGEGICDLGSGYRVLSRNVVKNTSLLTDYFEIETELTLECLEHGLRIKEIPISYGRRLGQTKLHPFRDGVRDVLTIIRIIRDYRPLLLFGVLGSVSFVIGGLLGIFVLNDFWSTGSFRYLGTGMLAMLCLILGVQLFSTGLLAEMTSSRLKRLKKIL